MAGNYAKPIPRDNGGASMTDSPAPVKAQIQFYKDNGLLSSVQTMTDNTTQIEVGTTNGGAMIRWVPATEGAAAPAGSVLTNNFDHYIPANMVRTFVVPRETMGSSSIVGANVQNGLYRRFAIANLTIASVVSIEY